ncbi:hypothetical protein GOP47_0014925 [Adiantum capillus-veneris]|uniref:Large ribosomal subunit protein bL21m n=1 Tax=Adiantum capillus-veneris TaxID=13818 RepID=A0A9D4ZDY9_ADICA|nr:hypothetical protein GOP47_0014925 [Adiantum capillus-veneris]
MATMALKACFRGRSRLRHPLLSHSYFCRGCSHGLVSSAMASAPSLDFCRSEAGLSSYVRSTSARLHLPDSKLRFPSAQYFFSTLNGSDEDGDLSANDDEGEAGTENEAGDELELISEAHTPLPNFVNSVEEAAYIGYKVVGQVKPGDFGAYKAPNAFAVIQVGSHQFKISPGDCIYTEKLKFADVNDKLSLEKVLLLGSKSQTIIGRPLVPKAFVHAAVEEQVLDAKVIIFKKKRRKNYRRCNGHRQELTRLRILDIWGLGEARSALAAHQSPNSLSPAQSSRSYSTLSSRCSLPLNGALSGRAHFYSTVAQDISITDNCVNRLHEIIKEEKATADEKMLRVSVEGGGCSGFQYVFSLENMPNDTDRIFEKDGVKIVVDEVSMGFLKGATIDYAEELIRASFMVTNNPNASGGCGCGSSFVAK